MTRILLLEDEAPARDRLQAAILRSDPAAEVVASLDGVDAAAAWLSRHPAPDLVFADIQLGDGLSLDLLDRVPIGCPVVFCTAYDEYVVEAMARNGIDYLLKPIRDEQVARALAKYRSLEAHFSARLHKLRRDLEPRRRLLCRRRGEFVAVSLADVAYLVVEDKQVVVVAASGERSFLDRPLSEVEAELDPAEFFRLNRQYLVRAGAIGRFRPYFKGRLIVDLVPPAAGEVVVSQENVARFRAWLDR